MQPTIRNQPGPVLGSQLVGGKKGECLINDGSPSRSVYPLMNKQSEAEGGVSETKKHAESIFKLTTTDGLFSRPHSPPQPH